MSRYEQVRQLQAQGHSQREIAAQMSLDRGTVRRWLAAGIFPERAESTRRGQSPALRGFLEQLRSRWEGGCHNSALLYRELKEIGYRGSYFSVRRRVRTWQLAEGAMDSPKNEPTSPRWRPSPRAVAWLLVDVDRPRSTRQRAFLEALHQLWPELAENVALVQEFGRVFRERQAGSLEAWVQLAAEPVIAREIRQFSHILRRDWAAVLQAVASPWSSGQVEGQINRLKLIKRQMYGRANFDLLRQRVLHPSPAKAQAKSA
jgi:transposase